MPDALLIDVTAVILLGIGAQWMARRFQLPSLLLLLVVGFLAGPVLGLLSPQALQADWFYAFVSLAAGILLFEAGLNFRFQSLLKVAPPIFRILLLGGLFTWGLGSAAAHYLLDFEVSLAILLGLLLSITGPAVTLPLLRHVRPSNRVGTLARWEGVTAEPLRAILAVLVLNVLLLLNRPVSAAADASSLAERMAVGLGLDIFISLGVSVAATGLLVLLFQRRTVPPFLRLPIMLTVVLGAFVLSNVLQAESGLLTTTLLGIFLANQPYVSIRRSFPTGHMRVFLLGALFVLLSAQLELSALSHIDVRVLGVVVFLVVLVRPLAIFASTFGTSLTWQEKSFLAGLGPPGAMAAVLASLFAHRLLPMYPQEISGMVPIVFAVVVGMVAFYGLTLGPLARWLDVATPDPQGLLFVGAAPWVRTMARHVQQLGIPVSLLDNNPRHVHGAREEGLPARLTHRLSDDPHDDLDLSSMGRLLITVPHDEVAARTALHFSDVFDTSDIYHLPTHVKDRDAPPDGTSMPIYGRPLFGESASYTRLREQLERGGEIKILKVADDLPESEQKESYTYEELAGQYEEHTLVPFFIFRRPNALEVVSELHRFSLRPDDRLIALVSTAPSPYDDPHGEMLPSAEQKESAALEVDEPPDEAGEKTRTE